MITKTIFSGFGGQGVMMMGTSLAQSAMSKGYHVTYLPAYGAEMRGGTANCTVAVSDDEIASPVASEPNYLVVMNQPALLTFQNRVTPEGSILINSSIVQASPSRRDVTTFYIPCSDMAQELGNYRTANIVMMGAFVRQSGIVPPEIYLKTLETIMGSRKKALADINRKAFTAGYEYIQK